MIARERLVSGSEENEYAAAIQNSKEQVNHRVRVQRWAAALCPRAASSPITFQSM